MTNMSEKEQNIQDEGVKDETTQKEGVDKDGQPENKESTSDQPSENELSDAEKWEQKYLDANDKYIRLYSDFENFRKRTAREKLDMMESAGSEVIKELLSVLDDFERAIENDHKGQEDNLREGVRHIYNKLSSTLKNKGLEPMDSKGKQFDYELHEAITKVPASSKKEKGKVIDVIEKGYYFKGKVLRYAKVVVGE